MSDKKLSLTFTDRALGMLAGIIGGQITFIETAKALQYSDSSAFNGIAQIGMGLGLTAGVSFATYKVVSKVSSLMDEKFNL